MSLASDGVTLETSPSGVDLDWGFWDAQLRALDALNVGDHDIVVFRGGYGSGKSVLGARWSIEIAVTVPKSDNLVLAQDSVKGGPTTYKVFFEQLPGEDTVPDEGGDPENSPLVADYHAVDRRVTWRNGSITRLGSADEWNRYAGAEFNSVWMDEVAHYETTDLFKLNRMIISRQRTEPGPNLCLWTSTGNGYNEYHQFVEVQKTPDGDPLPTRITNIKADSRNNPFLNEKEKLRRQFEGTAAERQGLAGGFAAAEGLVYGSFSRARHVISSAEADTLATNRAVDGYDHGWGNPRVVVDARKTSHDQYLIYDLFYQSESKYQDAVDWLSENDKPRGTVYAEHEPEHQEAFRSAGYPCESAIKDLDEGIPRVREQLEVDAAGRPGLLVSDRCTAAIQEFLSYKEEHVGKSAATDHFLDSCRYLIMGDSYDDDSEDGHLVMSV